MFDIGFSEVLLIFVIALVVLGPEKLPRLSSQVGRWIGRARAMARQFKEQLEEEVNLEQVRKAHEAKPSQPTGVDETGPPRIAQGPQQADGQQPQSTSPDSSPQTPDPADFRADTFSHAHPTNEYGANPFSPDGAAQTPASQVAEQSAPATPDLTGAAPAIPEPPLGTSGAPPPATEEPRPASNASAAPAHEARREESSEAYAPATNPTRASGSQVPASATSGPTTGATAPTTRSDNHGH